MYQRLKAPAKQARPVIGPHPSSPYHAVAVHPISPDHEQPHGLGGPGHRADTGRRRPEDVQEENNQQEPGISGLWTSTSSTQWLTTTTASAAAVATCDRLISA